MPKIGSFKVYYWDKREKQQHDSVRHQDFKNELYKYANMDPDEFQIELADFARRHPEYFTEE